ncbi:DUF1127 domain-containing protein [Aureimonas populi]|uniref:DUF1127 domain-containing protein n=1 Tax=Aureimonas populi TaxID=1701758 RepID=A0ABW5CKR0_9HYPH|nr:DUF1127 domain-containing protein [Aureimonas populi]
MFSGFTRRLKNYRDYSRSVSELREMDDRMLADIGVMRGDIRRAVQQGR